MNADASDETAFGSTAAPVGRKLKTDDVVRFTPTLVCYAGAERGRTYSITSLETILGRGAVPGISLSDDQASRRHAHVLYKNWLEPSSRPECFIEDLGSRNGTVVNGQPLKKRAPLQEHDRIQIGETVLGFVIKDEQEININKSLFEQATKDPLTKLDNRRRFESLLPKHLEEAKLTGRPVSVLVVDADRFKLVNDTHGHDVGDTVLVHLAGVIRSCCRSRELCARWGGEEFVLLLPNCDKRGAESAAERIRSGIEQKPVVTPAGTLQVTVSLGGAVMGPGETFESAFRRADQELLKAKSDGRNRAHIAPVVT